VRTNLNLITEDVVAAVVVHPRRAFESPLLAGLRKEEVISDEDINKGLQPFIQQTGLDPREIEEVAVFIGDPTVNEAARNLGLPVEEAAAPEDNPIRFVNNMKQVGLAFHNYHDVFSHFPAADGNGDGEHNLGFSWRVQLAPFVDGAPVYNQINFDQEWDSDHNAQFHEQMPPAFATPGVSDPGETSMHVLTGEGTLFNGDKGMGIREITDGTSNTILAVAAGADTAENWMTPGGLEFDPDNPLGCLGEIEGDRFLVLIADGSVRMLPKEIEPDVFAALVTPQGGEVVPADVGQPAHGSAAFAPAPFGFVGAKAAAFPVVVLTMASPVNRETFLKQLTEPTEAQIEGGQPYFVGKGWAMAFPAEKTVVFGGEEAVQRALDQAAGKPSQLPIAERLRSADQPFDWLLTADVSSVQDKLQAVGQFNPLIAAAANLESITAWANAAGKPGEPLVAIHGAADSADAAEELANMFNEMVIKMLQQQVESMMTAPFVPVEMNAVWDVFKPGLGALEMVADGANVQLEYPVPEGFADLPRLLAPAFRQAEAAAAESRKRNKLKQIGLAFHNYHDTFKSFPGAGRPAQAGQPAKDQEGLSWRVHLLPFLDQAPLYNQFHMDEPWDSEHNRALIEQMPDIYKVEGVDEPGETSIHVFTGPGAPFADDATPSIRDFTDGTSNTLLCVQAAPETAEVWTKPGGLDFDADDPLAALGNIGASFLALMTDGSVRTISSMIKPDTLLHLIQNQDGQAIPGGF
jgi:hypothetical protein